MLDAIVAFVRENRVLLGAWLLVLMLIVSKRTRRQRTLGDSVPDSDAAEVGRRSR